MGASPTGALLLARCSSHGLPVAALPACRAAGARHAQDPLQLAAGSAWRVLMHRLQNSCLGSVDLETGRSPGTGEGSTERGQADAGIPGDLARREGTQWAAHPDAAAGRRQPPHSALCARAAAAQRASRWPPPLCGLGGPGHSPPPSHDAGVPHCHASAGLGAVEMLAAGGASGGQPCRLCSLPGVRRAPQR